MEVCPSQRVCRVGGISQAAAGNLSKTERDVYIAVVFKQQVGKIVCGVRIVGLNGQRLLVGGFCLSPIAFRFIESAKGHQDLGIRGGERRGALVVGDSGVGLSATRLYLGERSQRSGIGRRKLRGAQKGLLRLSRLGIAGLCLTEKESERGVVG